MRLLINIFLLSTFQCMAQDTIKVMWYNILNYPEINSSRIAYLKTILQYEKPDIFAVCEITSLTVVSTILNNALNLGKANYAMVNYIADRMLSICCFRTISATQRMEFNLWMIHIKRCVKTVTITMRPLIDRQIICCRRTYSTHYIVWVITFRLRWNSSLEEG